MRTPAEQVNYLIDYHMRLALNEKGLTPKEIDKQLKERSFSYFAAICSQCWFYSTLGINPSKEDYKIAISKEYNLEFFDLLIGKMFFLFSEETIDIMDIQKFCNKYFNILDFYEELLSLEKQTGITYKKPSSKNKDDVCITFIVYSRIILILMGKRKYKFYKIPKMYLE